MFHFLKDDKTSWFSKKKNDILYEFHGEREGEEGGDLILFPSNFLLYFDLKKLKALILQKKFFSQQICLK